VAYLNVLTYISVVSRARTVLLLAKLEAGIVFLNSALLTTKDNRF